MGIYLPSKFRLEETRRVVCPFMEDWTFTIYSTHHKPYRDYVDSRADDEQTRRTKENLEALTAATAKASAMAQLQAGERRGKALTEFVEQRSVEIMKDLLPTVVVKLDIDQIGKAPGAQPEAVALLVKSIAGVRTEEGQERPATDRNMILEVLDIEDPMPFEFDQNGFYAPAGMRVGAAVRSWLLQEAAELEKFHSVKIEESAGN